MIKEMLKSLAKSEQKKAVTLTTLAGDIFVDATIIDYEENPNTNLDEVLFYCTEITEEQSINAIEEFEYLDELIDTNTEINLVKHLWRADQICGISITTVNLSQAN